MEYETTVSLVFGGDMFARLHEKLSNRYHVTEDLDVYNLERPAVEESVRFRYRELKRYTPRPTSNECGEKDVAMVWDRKAVKRCTELQVPHIDPTSGRVLFVSTTYKESFEEPLTEEQWTRTVREDHSTAAFLRTTNKIRLSFPPQSFSDLFDGRTPEFKRLSLGEYSQYGGTLEARTKCNSVYYLEIEREFGTGLKSSEEIARAAEGLVEILFTVLPYRLVAETMRREAAATVQRERTDNVFDEFKRRFVDYNRCRGQLWKTVETVPHRVSLFLMPKWDGLKATASYCDGYLFVRDSCGSLSTYSVALPFDNDIILQLEILRDEDEDNRETLFVVTEILAVVVKSHDTLYHVYNRNNVLDDTGRFAGNVATSITLKTQFSDPNSRCNTYRHVTPLYSLRVMSSQGEYRGRRSTPDRDGVTAVNTYTRVDTPRIILTTVTTVDSKNGLSTVLSIIDKFHGYKGDYRTRPATDEEGRQNKRLYLKMLSRYLPSWLQEDGYFRKYCEGMLVAFVHRGVDSALARRRQSTGPQVLLADTGYVKMKIIDTVDLEYHHSTGFAISASGKHRFRVLDVPEKFAGWAERPRPVTNDRSIIECYFDRGQGAVVYLKDRPDKTKADSEEKIAAIEPELIPTCSIDAM